MGIKDLYPVIKKHAPEQLQEYHLADFRGKRFAVDVSVFLYKYIKSATDGGWRDLFILFLCKLKKFRIKAVFIFDGPDFPKEKIDEQNRRREATAKSVERLNKARRLRGEIGKNCRVMSEELIERTKAVLRPQKRMTDLLNYNSPGFVLEALSDLIERLEIQTKPIDRSSTMEAANIAKLMGISVIHASGEAEALCCYLACLGYVDAVLTEDTDVLAYGTPLMVAFKNFKLRDEKVYGIHTPSLLESLGMNQLEFTDLCILLSCDYNSRIKAKLPTSKKCVNIGAVGAYTLISTYGTIENFLHLIFDPTPLKYRRCRELFSIPARLPWKFVPAASKPPDYDLLERYIKEHRVKITVEYIRKIHSTSVVTYADYTSGSDSESLYSTTSDDDSDEGTVKSYRYCYKVSIGSDSGITETPLLRFHSEQKKLKTRELREHVRRWFTIRGYEQPPPGSLKNVGKMKRVFPKRKEERKALCIDV